MAEIAIGTAGWSYRDWEGIVYPRSERDKLRFLARYVDRIEIDTTFYRIPAPETVQSWHARTADFPGFRFTAKLHQIFTHGPGFGPADIRAFHAAMEPLSANGRLSHLLAQFRWDFVDDAAARRRLAELKAAFGDLAVFTLELRHASWQQDRALDYLRTLGVTLANLDYPLAGNSFSLPVTGIGEHAYLRLHGRNTAAWFDSKAGRDQAYNYCYGGSELDGILQRVVEIAQRAKSVTLVANNHYQGKAVLNALELKGAIAGRKVDAPADLVRAYPRLAAIVREAGDGAPRQGELEL